jgi:arginase family enzyme
VDIVPVDIEATYANIEAWAGRVISSGAGVIALGGDHSIRLPLLRSHALIFGPLTVLHFDAHLDT